MENIKKEISQVLKERRQWFETKDKMPEEKQPVVIRLCHRTWKTGETETEVYPAEDVKIGYYANGKWTILPPHPKYDYSPLSDRTDLRKDVDVTHWAIPEEKELEWWVARFNRTREYKVLALQVDPDHAKNLYRALIWGAALINQQADPEVKDLSSYLYDLQNCIDFDNAEAVVEAIETGIPVDSKDTQAAKE